MQGLRRFPPADPPEFSTFQQGLFAKLRDRFLGF